MKITPPPPRRPLPSVRSNHSKRSYEITITMEVTSPVAHQILHIDWLLEGQSDRQGTCSNCGGLNSNRHPCGMCLSMLSHQDARSSL